MSRDDAIRYGTEAAIAAPPGGAQGTAARPAGGSSVLTAREWEIAALLGRGLSNRSIAEELFISQATVARHVSNIFGKLGLSSRAQVAAWVADRNSGAGS